MTVLEKTERLCGRVISFEKDGYLIDGCATSISSNYTEYLKLMHEVGLGDQLTDASNIFGVVRHGEVHYVNGLQPIRSFIKTRLMSWSEKFRFLWGAIKLRRYMLDATLADPGRSTASDDLTINDVVQRCFGPVLTDTLMDPLMRVVTFGDEHDTTSVELYTGLVSASGRYVNVLGGLETLPRALAKRVKVKLRSPARAIERRDGKVAVTYDDAASGTSTTEVVDACVIASTFPHAAELCPQLAIEAPVLAQQTAYAESFVVHLGYAAPTTTCNPAAIALPRKEFPNNPAMFLDHNKAPDRAPPRPQSVHDLLLP